MAGMLSAREAAASVGVTERTIRNWISSGKLRAERTPAGFRVRPEDLPSVPSAPTATVPAMTADVSALVGLVDRLTRENRDLASLVGQLQERTANLQAQLALPAGDTSKIAPERPSANGTAEPTQQPSDTKRRAWWRWW
jgi:excisionase family DNA binding protein